MSFATRLVLLSCCLFLTTALDLQAAGAGEKPARQPQPGRAGATGLLEFTDDAGNRVLVPPKPQRIVSLTMFTDEVLLELVGPARLIAVSRFAADPAVSNVSDRIASIRYRLDLEPEVILSLRPDLVFVANWSDAAAVRQLRAAGVPVYLIATAFTVDQIEQKILQVALIVGEQAAGQRLVAGMNRRLQEIERRLAAIPPDRRLTVLDYSPWGAAMGRGTSWDEVVRKAGLRNAADGLPVDSWGQVPLSREELIKLDPDLLVLPGWVYGNPSGAEEFYRQVTSDPALRSLKAVRNRRVIQMPERLRATTSQYIVDAIEFLARAAYPELWSRP
jgi:iron complex transport system substrate-binding protein